jgi:lipoyl(octanoyl) transferase
LETRATFYKINRGVILRITDLANCRLSIIDLENFFTDIHKYLRFLEAIILTLNEYGIVCGRSEEETGFG